MKHKTELRHKLLHRSMHSMNALDIVDQDPLFEMLDWSW